MSRFLGHLCRLIHSYSFIILICLFVVPMRPKKMMDIKTSAMFPPNEHQALKNSSNPLHRVGTILQPSRQQAPRVSSRRERFTSDGLRNRFCPLVKKETVAEAELILNEKPKRK